MARRVILPIHGFLVASAIASPLLGLLQDRTGLDPNVLRLTVFSTAVGAGLVGLIWRRRLAYPPTIPRSRGRSLAASVAMCLLAGLAMWLLARAQDAPWRPPAAGSLGAPLVVVLVVQLLGAAAEEVGWRGLIQPLLETRLAAWQAALITGALFGAGHFYLAFGLSPAAFALFIVSAIAISLILALATVGRGWLGRVAIATALHFLINMQTLFLFADGDGSVRYFADLAAVFGLLGLVALWTITRWRIVSAD